MNDWICIKRNVANCKECGNIMSLWKNKRTGQYEVICEWCPNSFIPEDVEEIEKC